MLNKTKNNRLLNFISTNNIKLLAFVIMIICSSIVICACNLFSTRSPEYPNENPSNFTPPTLPDIVINNLINALQDINVDNYVACLSDETDVSIGLFKFIPSQEALSIYGGLFDSWSVNEERRYFSNLRLKTPTENKPAFQLNNSRFELLLADSAVFVAGYTYTVEHTMTSLKKNFSGSLQFTLSKKPNGLWSIKKWTDYQSNADSAASWSMLKAVLSN